MNGDFDEDEDPYFEPEDNECPRCNGEGVILICIDDMCRGAGECFHGDGYAPCPQCCTQPSTSGRER